MVVDYKYPLSASPFLATIHSSSSSVLFSSATLQLSVVSFFRPLKTTSKTMSPLKIFQASCDDKKQGIVAVLSSDDSDHSEIQPSSLRRTLSADMSSHKWISQMKKVASSQAFGKEKTEDETEGVDFWGTIVKSNKDFLNSDSKVVVVSNPYVHPLVKRSGNSLSEKSLEICTESLGSETGSDGFSSYPSSENGDTDTDTDTDEENVHERTRMFEDQWRPVKYSYKKSSPGRRSFPPPLPTLSGPDGESLRMQPRRDNGRLVLEAMSVPSQNNFRAQRHDGRLVLTLMNHHLIHQIEDDDYSKDEPEKEEEQKITKSIELPSGLLNVHRLASMMNNKSINLANRNTSLPPRPKVAQPIIPSIAPPAAAATSLNTYEYFWRLKQTTTAKARAGVNPLGQEPPSFKNSSKKVMMCKNRRANEEEKLVVMCSNGSCKEVRRTAAFWEPRCIATS